MRGGLGHDPAYESDTPCRVGVTQEAFHEARPIKSGRGAFRHVVVEHRGRGAGGLVPAPRGGLKGRAGPRGGAGGRAGLFPVADLSSRFRLIERYAAAEGEKAAGPGAIGQYRVAIRETLKQEMERPQAAPPGRRSPTRRFTPSTARVTGDREVTDVVRRYDAFRRAP